MEWRIIQADRKRRKYQIHGQLWDGTVVKLPGHRDLKIAQQMMQNIEALNRARMFGEAPPAHLATWIDGLPEDEAECYVKRGLLESRYLDKRRPLVDFLPDYLRHTKADNDDSSTAPALKVGRICRVLNEVKVNALLCDVTLVAVKEVLKKLAAQTGFRRRKPISQKSRREYVFALKSFFEWMVDEGKAVANPLRKLEAPSAKGDPVRKRRPLSIDDVAQLTRYLSTAPDRYPNQRFDSTPMDRLMVYWAAVMTGFRMSELRSLTRAHIDFDMDPMRVTVEGWIAKNGQKATIPVAKDFGIALQRYSAHLHPNAPLLRMPCDSCVLAGFHRDLDAAGVRRRFDNGAVIDFHTLRSTAIFWWVTQNKLHLLDVQQMARLKTLTLVQDYVDDYAPDFKEMVRNAPRVVDPNLPFARAG